MNWIELPATRGTDRLVNVDQIVMIRARGDSGETIVYLAGAGDEYIVTTEDYASLRSRLFRLQLDL